MLCHFRLSAQLTISKVNAMKLYALAQKRINETQSQNSNKQSISESDWRTNFCFYVSIKNETTFICMDDLRAFSKCCNYKQPQLFTAPLKQCKIIIITIKRQRNKHFANSRVFWNNTKEKCVECAFRRNVWPWRLNKISITEQKLYSQLFDKCREGCT